MMHTKRSILGSCARAAVAIAFGCVIWATAGTAHAQGDYDLVSKYSGDVTTTRGWQVNWVVPAVSNPQTAAGAIGEWYYNLESGIYFSGGGWYVYWFGDDNGLDITDTQHCWQVWDSGGFCSGLNGALPAGETVTFTYEWCDPTHALDLSGSNNLVCLWVDYHDGRGRQFLASDTRTTVEMYTHDMESFDVGPQVACNQPTLMAGQQVMSSSGTWSNMNGSSTWVRYVDGLNLYQYSGFSYSGAAATWTSCTNPSPVTAPCSPIRLTQDWYSGNMDTTDGVCLRTADNISGWQCSNFDGRTVQVNGTAVTCGGPLPPKSSDGYYYFDVSAGLYPYASFTWWN